MEHRNKWLAIFFMIFIFALPVVTVIQGFLPQADTVSQEQQAVLDNNGSTQEGNRGDTAQDDTQTQQTTAAQQPLFTRLQGVLNDFTERLFFRDRFISFNTELTSLITGGSYIESTQVLLGKNNWLFYKTELDGHPIWDYMGINHFTDGELAAIAYNLTSMRDYFEQELDVDFFITGIPNKEIVYAENMPDTVARVDEVSRAEQLAQYLWDNTDLLYVYPKQALLDAKEKKQVYYATDTHWNQIGAFVGLQEIFEAAYGYKADVDSVTFDVSTTDFAGDLAVIGGVADKYNIDTTYVFDAESADPSQYRDEVILVVGDSFSGFLSTVAKGYYKDVHWIYTQDFKMDMVEEYDADVIIWESTERYMETFLNVNLLNQ